MLTWIDGTWASAFLDCGCKWKLWYAQCFSFFITCFLYVVNVNRPKKDYDVLVGIKVKLILISRFISAFIAVWYIFPLSPAESRRRLSQGPGRWRWDPGPATGSLSWSTPQQPGSASWGRPVNSDTSVSWVRRTAANFTAVETRRLVYYLFMPGWILTWFNSDFWSTMKEYVKRLWPATIKWLHSCFRELLKGRWQALATLGVHEQHPVSCDWAQSKSKCVSLWQFLLFTFLRVWIPHSSLSFKGKVEFVLMKKCPFLIGAVTGVMCEPECVFYVMMYGCVCVHCSVQEVAASFFFFLKPHCEDKSFLCWQLSLLFLPTRTWKAEHLMWTYHKDLTYFEFHVRGKNFISCHSVESPCVLSYSVWLALLWSGQKRCEGAPWRFSVSMTSLHDTYFSLVKRGCSIGAFKRTAVLTQSVACNISLVTDYDSPTLL